LATLARIWSGYGSATGGVTVNLGAGTSSGAAGNDSLTGIEIVLGGNFADSILGDGLANVLDGGDGSDTITGLGGDDVIAGGGGDDVLIGDTAEARYVETSRFSPGSFLPLATSPTVILMAMVTSIKSSGGLSNVFFRFPSIAYRLEADGRFTPLTGAANPFPGLEEFLESSRSAEVQAC
jgi:Ca2+-binding RTX toxin-like protein